MGGERHGPKLPIGRRFQSRPLPVRGISRRGTLRAGRRTRQRRQTRHGRARRPVARLERQKRRGRAADDPRRRHAGQHRAGHAQPLLQRREPLLHRLRQPHPVAAAAQLHRARRHPPRHLPRLPPHQSPLRRGALPHAAGGRPGADQRLSRVQRRRGTPRTGLARQDRLLPSRAVSVAGTSSPYCPGRRPYSGA